jgi:hypothetical protein
MPWIRGKWVDDCDTATLIFGNGATLGLELSVASGCTAHNCSVSTNLSPTAWHSVQMVFTGNEVKVYVDGTLYIHIANQIGFSHLDFHIVNSFVTRCLRQSAELGLIPSNVLRREAS